MKNVFLFMTDRLAVRQYREDDVERLFHYSQQKSARELPNEVFEDLEEAGSYIEQAMLNYRVIHYPHRYAVVLKSENKMIGTLTFKRMQDLNIRVDILIGEEYQKKGYATELAAASSEYAKQKLGLKELYAVIRSKNEVGKRLLEKAEFLFTEEYEEDWFGTPNLIQKYKR